MFTEDITAIVLDPGHLTTRAGYSGEDTPKYWQTSFVGVIPEQKMVNENQME